MGIVRVSAGFIVNKYNIYILSQQIQHLHIESTNTTFTYWVNKLNIYILSQQIQHLHTESTNTHLSSIRVKWTETLENFTHTKLPLLQLHTLLCGKYTTGDYFKTDRQQISVTAPYLCWTSLAFPAAGVRNLPAGGAGWHGRTQVHAQVIDVGGDQEVTRGRHG